MFHWYGLIIGIAIVVGWSIAERIDLPAGKAGPKVGRVAPWVIFGGIVGARLYHVIHEWSYYGHNLSHIVMVWNGGLGIFGGILGGGVGLLIGFRNQDSGIKWKSLGAIVVGLPLAQAIGRLGNLVNDELWGAQGQPLFLYESVLNLVLFGVMWFASLRGSTPQWLVGSYLFGYGLIRLVLEPFKPDPWWVGYGFISLFLIFGVLLWMDDIRRKHL